jgi:hypothetical protein
MTYASLSSPTVANLITVSQLVHRAAPPTEDHRALWLRRARLWSVEDIQGRMTILPVAVPQAGSRKHRSYSEGAIFLAAVLFRISDFGITTDILRQISASLQGADNYNSAFSRMWRRIKRRQYVNEEAFISVRLSRLGGWPLITLGLQDYMASNLADDDAPAIILNLTRVGEELSAVTTEEAS